MFFTIVSTIFSNTVNLLDSVIVPSFNFSFLDLFMYLAFIGLGLKVIHLLFGFGFGVAVSDLKYARRKNKYKGKQE